MANRWLFASWLGLLVLLLVAPRIALDSGLSYDEEVQFVYGDLILAWYRSGFVERGALDYRNLYLYGGLFDLSAQWLVSTGLAPWGPYETRHVFTALIAVLGVVATWKAAAKIGGPSAGFLAGLTLALTPCWVGHGLFNPKDIPFAAAAAFVVYATMSIALGPPLVRWTDVLRAGAAFGFALGVRPGGMFLGAFLLLAALGRIALDVRETPWRRLVLRVFAALGRLACALPLVWALMLSAWPWAQIEPFQRPFEAAKIAAHFDWGGHMRFNGRTITTDDIPLTYLPVWFAVTLPETYLVAVLAGLAALVAALRVRAVERTRALAVLCLIAFVLVPYVGVVIKRPIIYDAHRHFLFLLPPMAALCGVGLSALLRAVQIPRAFRFATLGVWSALAVLVLVDMVRIHPYEYVYFNRSYGGLAAAKDNFETDYWGASFREGFKWVTKHIPPQGDAPVRVAVCDQSPGKWQLNYYRERWKVGDRYVVVRAERKRYDVYLAYTRNDCHKRPGEVLHVVKRDGTPLLYVLGRR